MVLLVALCGLLAPAAAWAAAPANDDFANRQVLPTGFPEGKPVEVKAANVGATKEEGENLSFDAAGHSVWYEWEAESTGWTTIGACEAEFPTIIGIFTGSEVNELTAVVSGNPNASEGPDCLGSQRQYTFKAQAGAKYEIAVDGNGFYVEPPPPVTEGEFTLRIEPVPPPPNDDFADAADLTAAGKIYEFEPGEEPFYFASLRGYNWGAGKETGEPEHEGDPGGASVWYRWTAPATGLVQLSACCVSNPLVGLYTGSAVDSLTPVPVDAEEWPVKKAEVIAGQTYMIAVDGRYDEGSGEAAQFSFGISAAMHLPAPTPTDTFQIPMPGKDVIPPGTTIAKTKLLSASGAVKFWLSSSEAGGGFLCRLDKAPFKPCGSPRSYRHLKPGRHTFRAAAVDAAGNVDPSPAVARIKMPRKQKRRGR